ncbi:MAG: hypothetical protein P4L28_01595 [Paludibacteraceae bacterium]|nr:hypothetical protein [Paludibacteraceae bacterium]
MSIIKLTKEDLHGIWKSDEFTLAFNSEGSIAFLWYYLNKQVKYIAEGNVVLVDNKDETYVLKIGDKSISIRLYMPQEKPSSFIAEIPEKEEKYFTKFRD